MYQVYEMPSCYESLSDPCFDLRFVEDRADSALDLVYQKSSIWDFPQRSEVNSTGSSIVLTLTMWNIERNSSLESYIEIFDSDDREIINTKNENRRPPAILSSGNRLTVHFNAHDFTQTVGFRARYEFVDDKEWSDKPNSRGIAKNLTNCDEFLEGYGGEIKLDGHLHLINTYVDCIWIVGRFPHMARTFDRIYLKVEEFHMKGVGLRLEVREGASSTSDRLLLLFDSQTRDQIEHKQPRHGFTTTSSNPAFYVRLRGYLMGSSGLEIVYTQFYRWATALCPGAGEYHCDNARCIKSTLRCDGVNHCGDGSDEQCQRPITDFKQTDTDVSGLIALVIGVCGLILLIISTTAVMGRFYRRRMASQFSRADLSAVVAYPPEAAVPTMQTVGERRFYVVPENQISVIEAPPSYDDALKHPAVPTSRIPSYMNRGFVSSSTSEERMTQSPSAEAPPPAESSANTVTDSASEADDERSEATSAQASPRSNDAEEPGTSTVSPIPQRKDDESWV
ncbi:Low-density lipoprotein receptor domain class A [Oesophagostomum dentatum]|uniref:Low-density lipoprotein receptor domain class A n=1 Tax=Oesophagostomum dentatum TaxID=61180 RepID=A0A0B1TLW9_OESDE|nr:Low-density lipoprotein receptor domain class A [Oesophagostomum dentatum]